MMRKSIGLAVAAMMCAAGMAMPAQQGILTERVTVTSTVRQRKGTGFAMVNYWNYSSGPGWTAAHVKRMAKKRRNQQRHRKACRKGGA